MIIVFVHQSLDLSSAVFEFIRENADKLTQVFDCLAVQPFERGGDAVQGKLTSGKRKKLDYFYEGLREPPDWRTLALITLLRACNAETGSSMDMKTILIR
jgi:hypothetical protein